MRIADKRLRAKKFNLIVLFMYYVVYIRSALT